MFESSDASTEFDLFRVGGVSLLTLHSIADGDVLLDIAESNLFILREDVKNWKDI